MDNGMGTEHFEFLDKMDAFVKESGENFKLKHLYTELNSEMTVWLTKPFDHYDLIYTIKFDPDCQYVDLDWRVRVLGVYDLMGFIGEVTVPCIDTLDWFDVLTDYSLLNLKISKANVFTDQQLEVLSQMEMHHGVFFDKLDFENLFKEFSAIIRFTGENNVDPEIVLHSLKDRDTNIVIHKDGIYMLEPSTVFKSEDDCLGVLRDENDIMINLPITFLRKLRVVMMKCSPDVSNTK